MSIGDEIRAAREARGLSQKQLADAIGVSQVAITKIENGGTVKSKYLPDIERYLDMAPHHKFVRLPPSDASRPVPIMATAEDDRGGLIMSEGAIDWIPRPPELSEATDAYGILVSGYEMHPRYRPGEIILIHPKIAPRVEDGVVLFRDGGSELLIREFIRSSSAEWVVRRLGENPGEERISRKDWPRCHTVWGVQSRR